MMLWCATPGALAQRTPSVQANFWSSFMPKPQPSPADVYDPDLSCPPAGLPVSFDDLYQSAVDGVIAALDLPAVEVDFPPVAAVNARGDGSAQSERLVNEANAAFATHLLEALRQTGRSVEVVGCTAGALAALQAGAISLDAASAAAAEVLICVSPFSDEQWDALDQLDAGTVVVVNGLLSNGRLPHAYYYKPLSAFSAQTGGVVRRYPGPYECYDSREPRTPVALEVPLATQGRRALPDTKGAQMFLQSTYGRN